MSRIYNCKHLRRLEQHYIMLFHDAVRSFPTLGPHNGCHAALEHYHRLSAVLTKQSSGPKHIFRPMQISDAKELMQLC